MSDREQSTLSRPSAKTSLELFSAVMALKKDDPKLPEAIRAYANATGQSLESATSYVARYRRSIR